MSNPPLDRRQFAVRLGAGLASAAPLLSNAAVSASEAETPPVAKKPAETAANTLSSAELILELVKRQYPDRLTDESLKLILADIGRDLARCKSLSSFPLTNADEPAFIFSAYRSEG